MIKMKTVLGLLKNNDQLARFNLLCSIGKRLLPNYRFVWPQMEWWDNKKFNAYLQKFEELNGMNSDRRWMLYQLMRLISNIPGDTAECGVYKGAGSYAICLANRENPLFRRKHHVFDSFEGLSTPLAIDGDHWSKGNLTSPLENTANFLSEFAQDIEFFQGWIPTRFPEVADKRYALVHIDVDLYQPTLDSIEFFYQRMNDGGLIVCDDYGFSSCPGARLAVDEFLSDKPEKMISLSGGGGFMIKNVRINQ